jgi:large subunit ribosomal protein L24
MNIWKGDEVVVITGKEKGKRGRVLSINRDTERVVIEGLNMRRKHQKPSSRNTQGGILEMEGSVHLSNVRPWCATAEKPSPIVMKRLSDGSRVRVYKVNGETVADRSR